MVMYISGMTKIIYCVDVHNGPVIPRFRETDVTLYGPHAKGMLMAMIHYAHQENADKIIIGGDESSYHPVPETHLFQSLGIWDVIRRSAVPVLRGIGNHERTEHQSHLNLTINSFSDKIDDTRIIVLQPDITRENGKDVYHYNPSDVDWLLNGSPARNTLVIAHWAFDRMDRGYPAYYCNDTAYAYRDNADKIKKILPGGTIVLSGHEHRANFSDPAHLTNSAGVLSVVVPSIVQQDINDPKIPCGIFVEITDDGENGTLRLNFKRVSMRETPFNKQYVVEDVAPAEVARYYRPYIPG